MADKYSHSLYRQNSTKLTYSNELMEKTSNRGRQKRDYLTSRYSKTATALTFHSCRLSYHSYALSLLIQTALKYLTQGLSEIQFPLELGDADSMGVGGHDGGQHDNNNANQVNLNTKTEIIYQMTERRKFSEAVRHQKDMLRLKIK